MLPSHHHPKPRSSGPTGSVYVCSLVSLVLCLLLTFTYWRWEVNSLIAINEQIRRDFEEVKKESLSKDSDLTRQAGVMKGLQEEKNSYQEKASRLKSDLDGLQEHYEKLKQDLEDSNTKLTNVTSENEEYTRKFEVLKTEYENLDRNRSEEIQQLQTHLASLKANAEDSVVHTKSSTQDNISGQAEGTDSTTRTEVHDVRVKTTAETGSGLKNPRTGNHETMQQGMLAQTEIQDIET